MVKEVSSSSFFWLYFHCCKEFTNQHPMVEKVYFHLSLASTVARDLQANTLQPRKFLFFFLYLHCCKEFTNQHPAAEEGFFGGGWALSPLLQGFTNQHPMAEKVSFHFSLASTVVRDL